MKQETKEELKGFAKLMTGVIAVGLVADIAAIKPRKELNELKGKKLSEMTGEEYIRFNHLAKRYH